MEIKAKCRFDKETCKELAYVSVYKKSNPRKTVIARTIISIILILICFAEVIAFDIGYIPIILIIVLALVIFFDCFFYFILPRIQYKSMAKMKEVECEYVFYDNEIKVSTVSKDYSGEARMDYSVFVKAYETSKCFFMCPAKNQFIIVDKSTVENGSISDIRALLSGAIKGKYIICKY